MSVVRSGVKYSRVAIAREVESLENPGARERRVAVVPADVERLVSAGCEVFVERGAGDRIGFDDAAYEAVGATVQGHDELYAGKSLVIKLRGPAHADIAKFDPGTVLLCMARVRALPERARLLKMRGVSVVAMEEMLESPGGESDLTVSGRLALRDVIRTLQVPAELLQVYALGFGVRVAGALREAADAMAERVALLQPDMGYEELESLVAGPIDHKAVFIRDSNDERGAPAAALLQWLRSRGATLLDISEFMTSGGQQKLKGHRVRATLREFGSRRIQCLHETGQAGARFGYHLLQNESPRACAPQFVRAVVLGHSDAAVGAIHECHLQGARAVWILGPRNTAADRIEEFLGDVDLVVTGAVRPAELRTTPLIPRRFTATGPIRAGAAIIDLLSGSTGERSAVETIDEHTTLENPFFIVDGVYFAAVAGWPSVPEARMLKQSAAKYSGQIAAVLLGRQGEKGRLLDGIEQAGPGVRRAWVIRPSRGQ